MTTTTLTDEEVKELRDRANRHEAAIALGLKNRAITNSGIVAAWKYLKRKAKRYAGTHDIHTDNN